MTDSLQKASDAQSGRVENFDAIVIGAGVSGLYQLYRLRELGLSVRCLEDGGGVGGTWYWNRYPGCRFDSESESYGYSFSKELLQEWDWKEHYSGQPENERYLNYVADKFDLRRDIQFNSRVASAVFDERANRWEVQLESGQRMRAQFVVAAVGILSARNIPPFEGVDSFKGESFHTSRWPKEKVDFTGKRVAVIGTGATAVQMIPIIAKEVGHLTVFQRTANYCAPLRNSLVSDETQRRFKATYPEIHKRCKETTGGFLHEFDRRAALDLPREERRAVYEQLWAAWLQQMAGQLQGHHDRPRCQRGFRRVCAREDPCAGERSGSSRKVGAQGPPHCSARRTITSPSGTSGNPFLPGWIAFLEHGFYRETFQIVGLSPDAALRAPVFRGSRGSPRPVHS